MRLCQSQLLSSQSQCITEGETELMSTNTHGHTQTRKHTCRQYLSETETALSLSLSLALSLSLSHTHTHTHAHIPPPTHTHTSRLLPVYTVCCASSFSPFPSQICFRLAPLPTALACHPLSFPLPPIQLYHTITFILNFIWTPHTFFNEGEKYEVDNGQESRVGESLEQIRYANFFFSQVPAWETLAGCGGDCLSLFKITMGITLYLCIFKCRTVYMVHIPVCFKHLPGSLPPDLFNWPKFRR